MCHKAPDNFLPTLKFVPDWFVTKKMPEKLDNVVLSNDYADLDDMDSDIVKFFTDDMDLVTIDLTYINLDYDNFDQDDPETTIYVRFMDWGNRFKQRKSCKRIGEQLIPIAWYPARV